MIPSPPLTGQQVARKTAHGIFWNYVSFGLGKGLVFLTVVILARLLTPAHFGLVALAMLAVNYLGVLKDFGLGAALIQRRQDVEEAAQTIFTLNLLLGLSLTLTTIALAPFVAVFFQEPLVTPVLRWLSLSFVLEALGSVHIVRLKRELDFRRKLIPDIGRSVLKGLVSIGLALAGFGVWSLVIGQLAGVATAALLAWLVLPWRPRLSINLGLAREMSKYGLSLMGLDLLAVLENNLDYLLVGRIFGNATLGIYTMAYRLPELLGQNTLWVIAAALFPAYASVQHQPGLLRQGFLVSLRFTAMLTIPITLGMALAAEPLVRVFFGEQWLAAIPVLRILALLMLVTSIGFNVGDVYKAVGQANILIKLSLLRLALMIPALWCGTYFGLVGVALGHLLAGLWYTGLSLWMATRILKVGWSEFLLQLRPSGLSGLALLLLAWPTLYLTTETIPLIRLPAVMIAGAVGYLSVLWLLERETLLRAARTIGLPGLGRKSLTSALVPSPASDGEAG